MTCFYCCEVCGNIIEMVNDSGVNPVCCGKPMTKMQSGAKGGEVMTHKPHLEIVSCEIDCKGFTKVVEIHVGEIPHKMLPEHYIVWVVLETDQGIYRKCLNADMEPVVQFAIQGDERIKHAYAYCNRHGLWYIDH